VAVGIGASHLPVDAHLVAVAALGLALSACLWWIYFGGDDERAERALAALPPVPRARAALNGFGYWHLVLLLGIVTVAAAERKGFTHPFDELRWSVALMLAGGVALFLVADALFRRELGLGSVTVRAATALVALATVPVGALGFAAAQIGALVALLVLAIFMQGHGTNPEPRRTP
jgi:low temperature requirement protein LtrA